MTNADLIALLPLIVPFVGSVVMLLMLAFYREHRLTAGMTLATFAIAIGTLPLSTGVLPRQVTQLLILDTYAFFYMGLLFATAFAVTLLAHGYFTPRAGRAEEYYLLLVVATLGAAVLVASSHFASFFLGLEILSVSLYTLIAYQRVRIHSIEAGLKYLILAALSAAFLLFGLALIYADLGTMELTEIADLLTTDVGVEDLLVLSGLVLALIGVGFKLAVVPFHMWTPDIYQGAAVPTTAFVATVSKGGMFAFLLRYFVRMDVHVYSGLFLMFVLIAIASMFIGNLLALLQNNVKRILAYSSIAHLGYLLVAFLAGGAVAVTAATYYLIAYMVTILGAFSVVTLLSHANGQAEDLSAYQGLYWRRPWIAGIFTAMLLSLAGIPLTAGFIGKFYLVTAGIGSALWVLVIALVVSSAIGLYYYLRIVVVMAREAPPTPEPTGPITALPLTGGIVLAAMVVLLVWLGIYPSPFIDMIEATVTRLI